MKSIDAIWEKRNLGIYCKEITIESNDNYNELREKIFNLETQYNVIKVPSHMFEICNRLQEDGYMYVETIVVCYNNAQLPELSSIQKRIVDSLTYIEMNDNDLKELFSEVANDMFETDRISMDSYFTSEQANNRYKGWINDELSSGSRVYKLVYKNNTIGFFILKARGDSTYSAVLGGIYKKFKSYGFGFSMNYFEITECINQNGRRIYNAFSTNNKGASSIHFLMNYYIESIYNVFVKHKN